jgi:hypothetical protein
MERESSSYIPRWKKFVIAAGITAIGAVSNKAQIESMGFLFFCLATEYEVARYLMHTVHLELESVGENSQDRPAPAIDLTGETWSSDLPEVDSESVDRMMRYIDQVVYGRVDTEVKD